MSDSESSGSPGEREHRSHHRDHRDGERHHRRHRRHHDSEGDERKHRHHRHHRHHRERDRDGDKDAKETTEMTAPVSTVPAVASAEPLPATVKTSVAGPAPAPQQTEPSKPTGALLDDGFGELFGMHKLRAPGQGAKKAQEPKYKPARELGAGVGGLYSLDPMNPDAALVATSALGPAPERVAAGVDRLGSDWKRGAAYLATLDKEAKEEELRPKKKGQTGRDLDREEEQRAMQAATRQANVVEKCWFCPTSSAAEMELVVAMGTRSYLALPAYGRLVQGHCLIVPMDHVAAMASVDDDVVQEIRVCCMLAVSCYFVTDCVRLLVH